MTSASFVPSSGGIEASAAANLRPARIKPKRDRQAGLGIIECCKLNAINPHEWLTETLARLANGHPANRVGELMPWTAVG